MIFTQLFLASSAFITLIVVGYYAAPMDHVD